MNKTLKYISPAKSFTEALPLGNGSLGAMVYGGVPEEKITLNYDTFWSGTGHREEKEVSTDTLEYARKLLFEEKFWEAEQYMKENMLGFYNESYMPLGILNYEFEKIEEPQEYVRSLDLEKAVLTSEFKAHETVYTSRMFISNPAKALVIRITSNGPDKLSLRVELDSKVEHLAKTENNNCLLISGNAPSNVQPNYVECDHPIVYEEKNPGMAFCCYLQAVHIGGSATVSSDSLSIKDADEIVFYLTAADGYKGYDQKIETNPEACEKNCRDQIRILNSKTYDELEKEHIKDYQSVYKDVSLELDGEEYDLPTDERLRRVQNGKQDLGLSCLFFHYNRYLMIASSRKGTQPANLQGIWSESIRPVWSSNWTTNINTEMNYWLNGPCNLIESFEPFVDFVEELSHAGEETAKKQCHCSGWTANHNVDIWRQTGPVDGEPKYAYWPMGGVWLCSQSYEYFRYSEDLKTLKNKIYPSLRGSVLFCLDWMQQREDGLYYTAPSTSPENTFEDDEGHSCGVSYMTTMDLAIIKELFANYLAAADVLGIEEDLIKLVKERSKLLPGYQIGKTGMIQEWIKDFEKSDVGHRHFSPVFGFHPGHSIKKTDTELVQACQNFIEEKAENFKQQIGWSCAWLINLWARLGDGTKANHYYEELLRQSVYDNLFDLHPPLGETEGEREVFQIDGNFGSASGVAEMLISSEKGKITILPALPDSWKNGKVRGLLAAGAIEVDITWKDRKPVSVSLRSSSDQNVKSSSLIASSIARRVLSFTVLPLMYLETVPTESPARAATSRIVEAIITPPFLI